MAALNAKKSVANLFLKISDYKPYESSLYIALQGLVYSFDGQNSR